MTLGLLLFSAFIGGAGLTIAALGLWLSWALWTGRLSIEVRPDAG